MKAKIVIDYKSMAFPMESLGGVTHAGVKYAPGDVFDAGAQHTQDRLIRKGRAKVYSPNSTQAVDVRAESETEVQPGEPLEEQRDAFTSEVPDKVDNHDEQERGSPEGERSGSEEAGSTTSARARFFRQRE